VRAVQGEIVIVSGLLLLAYVAAVLAPDTKWGEILREGLIDFPARVLNGLTPQRTIIGLIVFLIVVGTLSGASFGSPEWLAFGFADLSFYIDIAVMAMLMRATVRLKPIIMHTKRSSQSIAARLTLLLRRTGTPHRRPHARRAKPPSSTDESEPASGWAFA
jgi:hypothetical protein